jgi:hypothetical protein
VSGLIGFWRLLETNFPFGGARRHLGDVLGLELVAELERMGALKQQRIAHTYPCSRPSSDHCPRRVVEIEGVYHAVCGRPNAATLSYPRPTWPFW